ncbi:MAG: hypothetical protein AAF989_06665, partial [Planctomycetota bacterium]
EILIEAFGKFVGNDPCCFQDQRFGVALTSVEAPKPPVSDRRGPRGPAPPPMVSALSNPYEADAEYPMWRPGLVFVGELAQDEAIAKAKEAELDFLVYFDVSAKKEGRLPVQNRTRCRLIHTNSGKLVVTTGQFDNFEVMELSKRRRSPRAPEPPADPAGAYIRKNYETFFSWIEKNLALVAMPKLSHEAAKRRVASLLSSSAGSSVLPRLAEIRLYQHQGALSLADVEKAYEIMLGEDGLTLIHGTKDAKRSVLDRLLEQS